MMSGYVLSWALVCVVTPLVSIASLTSAEEFPGAASSNTTFFWRTSAWSPCEYRAPGTCCECQRRRNVTCVWRDGVAGVDVVPPFYCRKLLPSQPADREPCSPCLQPCVLSLWGEWSPCTHTCGHLGSRHRRRTILLAPSPSPSPGPDSWVGVEDRCGALMDFQQCSDLPECMDSRPRYRWEVGPWTSCRKVNTSRPCGRGQRVRQVQCVETSGGRVADDFCNYFVEGDVPLVDESCPLPCDCRVGSWSDWGPCSITCHRPHTLQRPLQSRTRSVRRPQHNGGVDCPALIETRLCDVHSLPTCTRHVWHVGEWSECTMPSDSEDSSTCGSGKQSRVVDCIRDGHVAGTPVEDLLCLHDSSRQTNGSIELKPVREQACKVPCPQDCQLGEWQNWSGCTQSCGTGGVRIRTKPILVEPTRGGSVCRDRYENKPCDPVPCNWWHTGRWSTCFLASDSQEDECGVGRKVRNVYCLSSLDEILSDSLCMNSTAKPPTELPCQVPCQDDCIISDWSKWGTCSVTCGPQGGLQYRTRTAHANGDPNTPCLPPSELEQSRICNQKPCKKYLWQVSAWSNCQSVDYMNATTCRNDTLLPGRQTRQAHCEMDPGYPVDKQQCDSSSIPETERDCDAPCPQDCELSDWSDWSQCSHTCGRHSHKVRLRHVLKLALHAGKSCPDNKNGVILQKKKCKRVSECHGYKWLPGKWSSCQNTRGCGIGIQARNVTCIRSDYKKVRDNLCLDHVAGQSPDMEQECFVPCPGDCQLSPWSSFTPCSQTCGDQPGIQTRTRHLLHLDPHMQASDQCPSVKQSELLETVSCTPDPCPTYTWLTGAWGSCIVHKSHSRDSSFHCGEGVQRRHVLCVRDDGVHVSHHLCDAVGPIPKRHMKCGISCPVDCEVTRWTDWTNCSVSCGTGEQRRVRQIVLSPVEGGRQCPHLVETRTCSPIDCEEFDWAISEWSKCQPTYGLPCGRGKQYRSVQCPAGPAYEASCEEREPRPPSERSCDVPCFGDCHVGQWTSVSECDCNSVNATERRTRIVVKDPVPSGEPCPPLEEEVLCDCHSYQVLLGDWTSCQIWSTSGNQCGRGKRERVANCVRNDGRQMSLSRCDTSDIILTESCEVECPVDCELSRLTHWSKCSSECGLDAVKTRWQSPMTRPNPLGWQCPPDEALVQNTTCHSNPCYTYSWFRGAWSECSVEEHRCGLGTRQRLLQCHRSDGTLVDHKFCLMSNPSPDKDMSNSLGGLSQEVLNDLDLEMEQICGAACPGDCLVSEWSSYGPCFRLCEDSNTTAVQVRTRIILQPSLGGKPCPEELLQSRVCESEDEQVCPVFMWEAGDWDEEGKRRVYCQLQGSVEVEGGCLEVERPSHQQRCPMPCDQFASCIEGLCQCKQGFVGDGLDCLPTYGCELHSHCVANQTMCNIYNKECLCEDGMLPTADLQCPLAPVEHSGKLSGLSTMFLYVLIGSLCALMLIVILCVLCMARRKSKKKGKMDLYAPNLAKIENLDNRRNNELSNGSEAPLLQKYNINSKNLADDPNKGPRYTSNLRSFAERSPGKEQQPLLMNGTLKSSNQQRLVMLGDDKDHDYVPMYGTTPDRSLEPLPPPPPFRSHSCEEPLPLPPPPMRVSPRVYEPLPPPPPHEDPVTGATVVHVPSRASPPRTDGPRLSTFKPDSPTQSTYSSSGSTSSSSARSSVSDLSGGNISARSSLRNSDPETQPNMYENTPGQTIPVTPPKKQSPPPFMPAVNHTPPLTSFKPHSNRGSLSPPRERSGQTSPSGSGASSGGSSPTREGPPPGQLLDYCDELIAELEYMAKS